MLSKQIGGEGAQGPDYHHLLSEASTWGTPSMGCEPGLVSAQPRGAARAAHRGQTPPPCSLQAVDDNIFAFKKCQAPTEIVFSLKIPCLVIILQDSWCSILVTWAVAKGTASGLLQGTGSGVWAQKGLACGRQAEHGPAPCPVVRAGCLQPAEQSLRAQQEPCSLFLTAPSA